MTLINFKRGHPNESDLPIQSFGEILATVSQSMCISSSEPLSTTTPTNTLEKISSDEECLLNYGDYRGNENFLSTLAEFVTNETKNDVTGIDNYNGDNDENNACLAENLFVTCGVSHGLELMISVLKRHLRTVTHNSNNNDNMYVVVEAPTYFLACKIFQSHGIKVIAAPMNETTGEIDMDLLCYWIDNGTINAPNFMYLIPTNQNPTGITYSVENRQKIANFSWRYDVFVFADEVYHFLDWSETGHRPARMFTFNDSADKIRSNNNNNNSSECSSSITSGLISFNAFTKIYCPGVRIGWIEAPKPIITLMATHGYIVSQGYVFKCLTCLYCVSLVCMSIIFIFFFVYTYIYIYVCM